ncbi:vitamin K epoxide reductase family protein [Sphingomonas sp. LHG3406-1]|uniref:vitamin K epoxide reductase family protein n=1 Tax=Sphingomonas sp. LHG3406-1 TaxID=2804617 RepID=UPI002621B518|nr:vitamin K epoxide reductase family protein [Sphingomonas sp. LHG3406-1]
MDRIAPADLSRELREGQSADLTRRRWTIGLSLVGAAIGGVVTLYQTGIVKRLPDILPGKLFDAEKVDASDYAYRRMQMPDATLMVLTYGATAALAAAGGAERATRQPLLPVALAAKAWYDLATCLKLAREEWAENKALCSWCQVATLVSAATAALSLPEATRAAKALAT